VSGTIQVFLWIDPSSGDTVPRGPRGTRFAILRNKGIPVDSSGGWVDAAHLRDDGFVADDSPVWINSPPGPR
jgi:hypothetical protein